mmetsp:Transcript_2964/g.10698  ORF Transcript_2964/g.10698 Transcript_2964/m.10698 type:complete len:153 (-) Transcript_2964:227-685(-)
MSSTAALRLMSDLRHMQESPPEGCSASPYSDDNMLIWTATVFGPEGTPWEGGIFSLRLVFTEKYPDRPPRVCFTSDIFHPNVYKDGTICLDIIQDEWSPCHNVGTILTSIQSLLCDPNVASPANQDAAKLYQDDQTAYSRKVRRCAQRTVDC